MDFGKSDGGGGGSYLVVADSLVRAARAVRMTAEVLREGVILGLDDPVNVGHPELRGTLAQFTSRLQSGAEELIHRQHSIADRLTSVVGSYLKRETASAAAYRAAARAAGGPG